ncbi:MAG: PP2C family protein-serine/threonine phosphatase [Myxococcota bacterium]
MSDLLAGAGQWTEPATSGEHTVATAYVGTSRLHVLVVADGATGPVPSRLAAQSAVSALVSAWRSREGEATSDRLRAGFREAHQAVRRAAVGSHAEGAAGTSLVTLVVEAGRLTLARLGGGRAYLVEPGAAVTALGKGAPPDGYIGDGRSDPEIGSFPTDLAPGDRLILSTEATARPLAGDLDALCRGSSPQLVAQALVSAARRRGASTALALQVLEMRSESLLREAHPAVGRIDRHQAPTFDVDGRRVRGLARRSGSTRRGTPGASVAGVLGLATGALAAWLQLAGPAAPPPARPDPPAVDTTDAAGAEQSPSLVPLFREGTPEEAARAVGARLEATYAREGPVALDEAEAWIRAHRDPRVVEVLVALLDQRPSTAVRRWVRDLLPGLWRDPGPPDVR